VSGFYSVEGWNRDREARERQREGHAQGSLLSQVPADAPYDDPDAVIHVWTGEKWISYEKWLATAPIEIEKVPAPTAPPKEEPKATGREQLRLPMGNGSHE
jgi:hypothetical protein